MGKMNLLKANWEGKVGQTVGAKWKNKSTIRTYTKPSNPNTQAQKTVRTAFSEMTSFVALFADQIKYLSALNTAGQSVRNAIIQANKAQIADGSFSKADLLISKGGLQKAVATPPNVAAGKITFNWQAPTATNFTENAKFIVVLVQEATGLVEVLEAKATELSVESKMSFSNGTVDAFYYFLDKRGSNKVASPSSYNTVVID